MSNRETEAMGSEAHMREALEVIERLALALKREDDLAKIREGLDEIHAVARYRMDVATPQRG